MALYALKVGLSVAIIVAVTELSKREVWWGALLASLPLVSVLAMVWLYVDTGDTAKVSSFARGVFWLVLPSLSLFVVMPLAIRAGWGFWPALLAGCAATAGLYLFELWLLPRVGVHL
jgi:hypothetical protein